mmetsp:Transcript_23082/g.67214  ORF Transcript_23082/g.67214 Transcript_23082/m.67214 type:complete len:468 (-) Transcript_23082:120-1523(-)|eukprot:CAMPEP_0118974966 /NCGR_PEP_ID=MMETSP1173-20130426/14145_1 /TAXON_ID=1034831 /ORGANISM="Rhizochromulina marina cf, Strain CCMP1243" /LENGTH=467 /DNA_ID=CAMNT_0006924785 /DNA_START=129 /DNA_END=1532 /DNA_ORIENTATION=-
MFVDSELPEPAPRSNRFTKALEGRFYQSGGMDVFRRAEAAAGQRREARQRRAKVEAAARKERGRLQEIEEQLAQARAVAKRRRRRQARRLELARQTSAALVLESAWRGVIRARRRAGNSLRRCIRIRLVLDFVALECARRRAQRQAQAHFLRLLGQWYDRYSGETRFEFQRAASLLRDRRQRVEDHVAQILKLSVRNVFWNTLARTSARRLQHWWRQMLRLLLLAEAESTTPEGTVSSDTDDKSAASGNGRSAVTAAEDVVAETQAQIPPVPARQEAPAAPTPQEEQEAPLRDPRPRLPPREMLRAWKQIKNLALRIRRKYELHNKAVFGWIRARARIRLHAKNLSSLSKTEGARVGPLMKKKLIRALDWSRKWTDAVASRRPSRTKAVGGTGLARTRSPLCGEAGAMETHAAYTRGPSEEQNAKLVTEEESVSDPEAEFPEDFEVGRDSDAALLSHLASPSSGSLS